jgi:putative ABC transport system permease protein
MSAFRAALRISRRNAWRSKRRSALILTMIALPVAVATFLATAMTGALGPEDQGEMPLGRADAIIGGSPETTNVVQEEAGDGSSVSWEGPDDGKPFTADQVIGMFGPGTRVVQIDRGYVRYRTPQGYRSDMVQSQDLRDPIFGGTYYLVHGRLPTAPGEIVISSEAADRGLKIGQTVAIDRRPQLRVVGIILTPQVGPPFDFIAFPGSVSVGDLDDGGPGGRTVWMVDTPKAVSSADVPRLNARGAVVVRFAGPDGTRGDTIVSESSSGDVLSVLEVVPWIALMLLEVVLLAGPAFAVGQRRRAREFALIAAQGGSPGQLRGVAQADGLLFGVGAAVVGAAAGVGVAAPVSTRIAISNGTIPHPFAVPWTAVAIIMAMGVVAGLLASLAPAERAGRTDVVAVLTGRRASGRDRAGRPALGLALVAAGLTVTVVGARYAVAWIVSGALLTQLGLVAALPWLIARAGRRAAALPFPLRFAVRDAIRNRARTVPAVSAIMAAVTLFMAIGVVSRSGLSDSPTWADEYPQAPAGALFVRGTDLGPDLWNRVRARMRAELPADVPFVEADIPSTRSGVPLQADVVPPDQDPDGDYMGAMRVDPGGGGGLLVGDARLLRYVLRRADPSAEAALRAGKAVVLDPGAVHNGKVGLMLQTQDGSSDDTDDLTLPAVAARATGQGWARVVISPEAIRKHGFTTQAAFLAVDPVDYRVPPEAAQRITAELAKLSPQQLTTRLEASRPADDALRILLLAAAAAVLVLGMTFVATALAAAEARPDLAVMSAVGAAPRTRRAVKAGQALVISLTGVTLGVAAGLVAGVAARLPRTASSVGEPQFGADGAPLSAHPASFTIDVPWSLIVLLVVGLPLLAALVCGVFTRSRLPAPRRRPA